MSSTTTNFKQMEIAGVKFFCSVSAGQELSDETVVIANGADAFQLPIKALVGFVQMISPPEHKEEYHG